MEARDLIFSGVMVISSFVLTFRWLNMYERSDSVVVLSAMVLIGALAALMLSNAIALRRIEEKVDAKERSLRINIQSVEENLDKRLKAVVNRVNEAAGEIVKRSYR